MKKGILLMAICAVVLILASGCGGSETGRYQIHSIAFGDAGIYRGHVFKIDTVTGEAWVEKVTVDSTGLVWRKIKN